MRVTWELIKNAAKWRRIFEEVLNFPQFNAFFTCTKLVGPDRPSKTFCRQTSEKFSGLGRGGYLKNFVERNNPDFSKNISGRADIGSSPFNTSVLNPENLKISHKIKCHSGNNFQTICSKLLPPNRKIISCKSRKTLRNFCKLKSTVKKIVMMIYW